MQRGAHPKRALLLISDGQDNNSRYTFGELRRLLKESDVVLYGIGILGGNDAGSALGMEGQSILDELANVSGGKASFPGPSWKWTTSLSRLHWSCAINTQLVTNPTTLPTMASGTRSRSRSPLPAGCLGCLCVPKKVTSRYQGRVENLRLPRRLTLFVPR